MVIEKDGVKYACLPCIRGHRVKKCQHHDRQLAPLSKRGRQISQCNHCRDLRSSGSHVKCTCASTSVLNRLNGCLCEISQTCTCVARRLQNIQADTPTSESNNVSLSLSPSFPTTAKAAVQPPPAPAQPSPALVTATSENDPLIANHSSRPLISPFSNPSMSFQTPSLPASSLAHTFSQDMLFSANHDQLNHDSLLTTATNTSIDPSSTHLSLHLPHNRRHTPLDSSQASTSTSTPSPERDLIDIFLHKDIDDLLLL